jgi:hypothetical protein
VGLALETHFWEVRCLNKKTDILSRYLKWAINTERLMKERLSRNAVHGSHYTQCLGFLESSYSCMMTTATHRVWQINVSWALISEREFSHVTLKISLGLHEAKVLVCYSFAGDDPPRACTFPREVVPSALGSATFSELVTLECSMEDVRIETCITVQLFSLSFSYLFRVLFSAGSYMDLLSLLHNTPSG